MSLRLVCSSILVLSAVIPLGMQNPRERSILVTVLDPAGAPVKDVKPADLAVNEDGATREVVDVKPNGTLVIQARKTIKADDEEQQFVLTGTCRVEDVVADNTVLSTQMYDLRVEKNTKGAVRGATKRSWLGEILDAISPF